MLRLEVFFKVLKRISNQVLQDTWFRDIHIPFDEPRGQNELFCCDE